METPLTPPAAPAATPVQPTGITVLHPPSVSAADVLNIVNDTVQQTAPVVVQSLPSTGNIAAYVTYGEIGLAIINAIVQRIHQAHVAKTAPPA